MKAKINTLSERMKTLLEFAKEKDITVRDIIHVLAGRGQAALLIILVLPFCIPIQIPGFSTPFGIILFFIGLRIAFGHRTWIPQKILDHKISYAHLQKIAAVGISITNKLSFLTSTRMTYLVQGPLLHVFHGLAISLLAFLLALPLPIPFTNLFAAFPILFFGLALLEDDGILICVAYALFFICLAVFGALLIFGSSILTSLTSSN